MPIPISFATNLPYLNSLLVCPSKAKSPVRNTLYALNELSEAPLPSPL